MARPRLVHVVVALALVLAAAAFAAKFLMPSTGSEPSRAEIEALREALRAAQAGAAEKKAGFADAEQIFTALTDRVSEFRQRVLDKAAEVAKLQADYTTGSVSQVQFESDYGKRSAELWATRISLYGAILDRMIAASAFSDVVSDVARLRQQAEPLVQTAEAVVSMIADGTISASDLETMTSQLEEGYTQLAKLVDQICVLKVQQATEKVAVSQGLDLVLLEKNIALYVSPTSVIDITEFVKAEVASYL